jgi:hypothetical protein
MPDVSKVKVALAAPAGMNTLEGKLAAASLLESATWALPAGAGPPEISRLQEAEEREVGGDRPRRIHVHRAGGA